ncbi:MAG: hypothetical protein ACRDPC_29350, partial [Solirubrobacteraceae bacterium]
MRRYALTLAACMVLGGAVLALLDGVGEAPAPPPLQLDTSGPPESRQAGSTQPPRSERRSERPRRKRANRERRQ